MDIGKISAWLQVISTVAGITLFGLWPNTNLRNFAQESARPVSGRSLAERLENFENDLNQQLVLASQWKHSIAQQKVQIIHAQASQGNPMIRTRLNVRAKELESDVDKLDGYCQLAQSTLNELRLLRTEVGVAPNRVADWIGLKQLALERRMQAISDRKYGAQEVNSTFAADSGTKEAKAGSAPPGPHF